MEERRLERITDTAQRSARRIAGDAQEIAERAGTYVAQHARHADDQIARLTGRPSDAWMRDARRFVKDHPLQAVALTVGLGFVLGKILARD